MSELQPHSNPWAEKLQQATLPEVGPAWTAMEKVLDREMPVRERKDRRRWLLLILLLLLLIGICNCPGRGRLFGDRMWRGSAGQDVGRPAAKGGDSGTRGGAASGGSAERGGSAASGGSAESGGSAKGGGLPNGGPAESGGAADSGNARSKERPPNGGEREAVDGAGRPESAKSSGQPTYTASLKETTRRSVTPDGSRTQPPGSASVLKRLAQPDTGRNAPVTPDSARKNRVISDSVRKKPATPDSIRKKPVAKDSTRKKSPVPPKDEEDKETEKGFVAAMGFNQFFPIGGQQVSDFNSGGITGALGDYIPVPVGRYYFNKKLYVQLEVQFNAPQYTKKHLVVKPAKPDSLGPGRVQTSTVTIKKLLYFNVPLSVHYAPIDGLSLGAGLQFSRLRNAFGSFDTTITNTIVTPVDSVVGKREATLKGSTVYQNISTSEFRILLDVNYTYKHFILGMRYNRALSNFINVQIGSGNVTQSRNNSLQLYLRYILFDGRKKKRDRAELGPRH